MGWILHEESMSCRPVPESGPGNNKGAQFASNIGLSLAMDDEVLKKDAMAAPSATDADRALTASRWAFRRVLASWASDILVLRRSGLLSMAYRDHRNDNRGWSKAA